MIQEITSLQNRIIQEVKKLHERSKRDKCGLFFVEGNRIVEEAVRSDSKIQYFICTKDFSVSNSFKKIEMAANNINANIYVVDDRLFDQICDTQTPQGILAIIQKRENEIDKLFEIKNGLIIILENIQDPGNMGTIIRTAHAAGASGIVISKGSVDIFNPKVLRSTMGSAFHLNIFQSCDIKEVINKLKSEECKIYAAHLKGKLMHFNADMKNKTAIVIGNEGNGITDETAKLCTLIKIPMPGNAESLNASVSAGVIIYEYVRQNI